MTVRMAMRRKEGRDMLPDSIITKMCYKFHSYLHAYL
jgi:hypothetical protein